MEQPASIFLNILYAAIVDDVDGMVDRHEVRKKLDQKLERAHAKIDPDSWGTSDEAQAQMQRFMELADILE